LSGPFCGAGLRGVKLQSSICSTISEEPVLRPVAYAFWKVRGIVRFDEEVLPCLACLYLVQALTQQRDSILQNELEKTYCSHRQGLFSLALSITGCRQLAEDAIHSAFERLYRSNASVDGDLLNYVFASVRNASRDAVRFSKRSSEFRETIFNGYMPPETSANPADDLLTAERDQILRSAVDHLDEAEREVVVLKTFAGLTFDAVAEVLDQPAKTVATRYRRALIKLEEKLKGRI